MKRVIVFVACGIFVVGCSNNMEQTVLTSNSMTGIGQKYNVEKKRNYKFSSSSYVVKLFDENKNLSDTSTILNDYDFKGSFINFEEDFLTINFREAKTISDEEIVSIYGNKETFELEVANNSYISYNDNAITYSGVIRCQYNENVDAFVTLSNEGYFPYSSYSVVSSCDFKLEYRVTSDNEKITLSLVNYIIQTNSRYYLVGTEPIFYHTLDEIPDDSLYETDSTIISSRRMETFEFVFIK